MSVACVLESEPGSCVSPEVALPSVSDVPEFTVGRVTFRCWIVNGAYEWRSVCGRFRAGRRGAWCWSSAHGRELGQQYSSLGAAMTGAVASGGAAS